MRQMSTLFAKIFLKNAIWLEIQPVCRQKAELDAVMLPFHGKTVACAVKMTVEALPHLITVKQLQNLRTLIALIQGRVVQEDQFWQVTCGFKRCLQAHQFPLEHLLIVVIAPTFFKKPTPGATDGKTVIFIMIVI